MSPTSGTLPDDVDALRALVARQALALAERDALLAAREAELVGQRLLVERLRLQLARLRRMQFGRSSERLAAEADQLELTLEELEAEVPGAEVEATEPVGVDGADVPPARGRPVRRPLPEHLPREVVTHPAPDACPACGGSLRLLGEDVTEVLDWVAGRFRVVRHVRPKCSCRRCEAISQAAAPQPADPARPRGSSPIGWGRACSRTCWCPSMPTTCRSTARPGSWPARGWS